jgi:hypothetical protein
LENDTTYHLKSTSDKSITINEHEGISLSEGTTHRLIVKPEIVRESKESSPQLKLVFYKQRKGPKGEWENEKDPNYQLKAGELKRLQLDTREMATLLSKMHELNQILEQHGFQYGEGTYVVAPENEVIRVSDWRKAKALRALLKSNSVGIWEEIVRVDPNLANTLAEANVSKRRKSAYNEFVSSIQDASKDEAYWQEFFKNNTWIFGYGLSYRFLSIEQAQPNYGGTNVTGQGAQKGDYLMVANAEEAKFTVLVEIKKPHTDLLGNKKYRNGAWELHEELTGAVSQIQANCAQWEIEGAQSKANREALEEKGVHTVQPKGIIVIGNTSQLSDMTKRETFERFRRNLNNPEILTFDELCERAKFVVSHSDDGVIEESESDVPIEDIEF